jgi:CTP synthase (UTP-ammonia lyase)
MVLREIVLIGERDLSKRAHAGIEASIALFQRDFDPTLTFRWVPTAEVAASTPAQSLGSATGIWCVPGSPYESTDGALQAIRFARENQRVFFGTCGGFQHALMEFCQNVVGRNAAHQEMDGEATDPLIVKLTCSLEGAKGTHLCTLFSNRLVDREWLIRPKMNPPLELRPLRVEDERSFKSAVKEFADQTPP